jgi:hypothetical protein
MIDLQLPVIAGCPSHLTAILPLPAGEGRGEGESLGMEFRASSGEGELYHRGRRSALIRILILATSVLVRVHPWLKNPILRNEPKLKITKHCKSIGCKKRFGFVSKTNPFSPVGLVVQRFPSRLLNPIQERGFLEKIFSIFLCRTRHYSQKRKVNPTKYR